MDSVAWLVREMWDPIREQLRAYGHEAELHVYGAYPGGAAMSLSRPSNKVIIKGHAPTLDIMLSYRACLAPIRFGAGLKGKVVDSWYHGAWWPLDDAAALLGPLLPALTSLDCLRPSCLHHADRSRRPVWRWRSRGARSRFAWAEGAARVGARSFQLGAIIEGLFWVTSSVGVRVV